jgi:hypothetical protein
LLDSAVSPPGVVVEPGAPTDRAKTRIAGHRRCRYRLDVLGDTS